MDPLEMKSIRNGKIEIYNVTILCVYENTKVNIVTKEIIQEISIKSL